MVDCSIGMANHAELCRQISRHVVHFISEYTNVTVAIKLEADLGKFTGLESGVTGIENVASSPGMQEQPILAIVNHFGEA
jgi:hypothetical protein